MSMQTTNFSLVYTDDSTHLSQWLQLEMFNAIFYNFTIILWQSVLLMLETEVLKEKHQPVASQVLTLSNDVV